MNAMFGDTAPAAPSHHQLLSEVQKLTVERLGIALDAVMRQADDFLFDRSGQGAEVMELTALRDLRRARAQLRQTFESSVAMSFERLCSEPALPESMKRELHLLSEDGLEEQLASEQMVENLNRRHAAALELLDQRMAMLADRTVLAAGDNPAAPPALAQALRDALGAVEMSTALRIALYKFTERELATALTALYDRINARLGDAGILPRLLPTVQVALEETQAAGPIVESARVDVAGDAPEAAPSDHALFTSLIGLLQSWRQQAPAGRAEPRRSSIVQLGVPQLMSALSLLQSDPPEILDQTSGDCRLSLSEVLRREVLAGARRLGMGGDELNLSAVQDDAVDLVGMLFDVLLDERDFEPDVRRKIGRMLVPYVKVAVKDRRMFINKGHPARRFLNAVAEACEGNHGDVPQERELLERVDASIERLVAEFNEDVAIFETLEQELREFMSQHRQRIEIAERRAAETQRGRERLEHSRARAMADIESRQGQRQLPALLQDLLSGYAAHHLTQLGLRGGVESEPYVRSLATLDGLMGAFDAASCHTLVAELPLLDRAGLADMLASSGCVGAVADAAIDSVHRSLGQIAGESVSELDVLPQPVVVAEQPAVRPVLEIVGGRAQLDFDPEMAERMRALPIGTWLQLTGESGKSEPAKVSWVSPISSRLLFVNRRGARVLVASVEELAAMEKVGRVQLRPMGSAFDDALHQIMGRLQTKVAA
jgi:hypothetical protein